MADQSPLEQTVAKERIGFWKYVKDVGGPTEVGALIGGNAGIFSSSSMSGSSEVITGGVLTGDFIGGTIGLFLGYGYANREKFRDPLTGQHRAVEIIKDCSKLFFYSLPITGLSYAASLVPTYLMVDSDLPKVATATLSTLLISTVWHGLSYFTYHVVRTNADENILKSAMQWASKTIYRSGNG